MSQGEVISIFKDAINTAMLMSAPFLIVSIVLGVIISVFQAATQIHEQNIAFVPKILATSLLLIFLCSWLITVIIEFTERILSNINSYI
ncbi:MAG: fliQ [Clostridia bacterium]|nr:fliQ [Clostridia bacterium]